MEHDFATVASPVAIELDALLRDYLLGLVLIAGGAGDDESRPVQWVHVSDLFDPAPFLTPRTVLLTTGVQFGAALERETAEGYVRRLRDAGTTALGLGVGLRWDRIPPALIDACERLQLPLFRVPYDTPFIAVVRTAARLIEAESHAAASWGREQGGTTSTLGRRQHLAEAEDAVRSAVLKLLLAGQRDLAESVAQPILPRLPRGQVAVLSFEGEPTVRLRKELTPLAWEQPGVLAATRVVSGSSIFSIVAEHSEVAPLRRLLARHGVAAGISERGSLGELSALAEQAERAAWVARRQDASTPLDYRPEMHAGVLQILESSLEAARRAQGLLAPLTRHDERHQDELLRSLRIWLAHHGQTSPAAAELAVHRHTLRARVNTAASLLQRDLDDPDTRAELWAALRLTAAPARGGVGI